MKNKILLQPAYVIHKRPYLNSSLLVSMFTRDFGLIKLIAKGARRAKSKFKSILEPFVSLEINYISKNTLSVLIDAECFESTQRQMLPVSRYYIGMYMNEMIFKLTHEHDEHTKLFDCYQKSLLEMCEQCSVSAILRKFEIVLLRELGYGIDFSYDANDREIIEEDSNYYFYANHGFVKIANIIDNAKIYSGKDIIAMGNLDFSENSTLASAKHVLKTVISKKLENNPIVSSKMIISSSRMA